MFSVHHRWQKPTTQTNGQRVSESYGLLNGLMKMKRATKLKIHSMESIDECGAFLLDGSRASATYSPFVMPCIAIMIEMHWCAIETLLEKYLTQITGNHQSK